MTEPKPSVPTVDVRYYPRDGSVFIDTHYLIKGVAGAIFWKLAREFASSRRIDFSQRELRLAGHELRLPDVQDNLSARLLLLQRRLADRDAPLLIHRTDRGRFRIEVRRPLALHEMPPPLAAMAPPLRADWPCRPQAVTALASATNRSMCPIS